MGKWYTNIYRRNLVDMHIEDWDDEFFSEFNVNDYFNNLVKAHIESPMIYLQSHTGLCNFPTKVAKMHNAFIKKNKIKELTDKCKKAGMKVVGYYSLIFNTWTQKNHPKWAIRDYEGKTYIDLGQRYGLCCPNNLNYREFVKTQIQEMADCYNNLDGIFYDMPYWEVACHCDACKKRWAEEIGCEMPIKIDWHNEAWKKYIRKRQEWMGEFAHYVEKISKEIMPLTTCELNFAAVVGCGWLAGSTESINDACEFTGGDLYGDLYNHSFACKYYMGITKNPPFEYMTCRCNNNLREHTITKTEDMLANEVMLTCAHHGASLVIDAIDPKGTLDSRVYDLVGKVFEKQMPYEKYFEGEYVSDVAVYFDSRTVYNSDNYEFCNKECAIKTVRTLVENHILVSVIANEHLNNIEKYKMIFASALEDFDNENILKFIDYVKNGGNLYLSSCCDKRLMKEFFGAKYQGLTKEIKTYISPNEELESCFYGFNEDYPMPINYQLPIFKVENKGQVKGTITLPYTNPADNIRFASIHSNPPGIKTDIPAVMINAYGKGKVIWIASAIEYDTRINFRRVFMNLFNKFIDKNDLTINAELSKNIEIVMFKTKNGLYLSLVDLTAGEEAFEHGYSISIKYDKKPKRIKILPYDKEINFTYNNGKITFGGKFKKFEMFRVLLGNNG